MSKIADQYENATSDEIMSVVINTEDKKDKADLLALMRSKLRQEEASIRESIKKENEDSKEEKKLLKKTHTTLFETRKEYLEAYREMNSIMNTKSMLKHIDDFSEKVNTFVNKSQEFNNALSSHLEKLKDVKSKDE